MNNTHISNNSNDKKIRFFAQEFSKNQYRAGDCLKLGGGRGGGLESLHIKGGGLGKKDWGLIPTPMHTMATSMIVSNANKA